MFWGWGFAVGDGWNDILEETFQNLDELAATENLMIEVFQVREKMGSELAAEI